MANGSVIYWLTRPAEIGKHHQHELILAQDIGCEPPNSMSASDPGQLFEQGRSHAKRVIFMGDRNRDFSSLRIVMADHVVGHSDQPVGVECTKSILPICRLGHLTNELVEINSVHREEAEISIVIAQVSVERHNGL